MDGQGCSRISISRAGAADEYLPGYSGDYGDTFSEVIFTPQAPLLPSTQYSAVANCTAQPWKFQFTTGPGPDSEGPRLISVTPDPAAMDTSPFGPFLLRFNKPLLWARGTISLSNAGSASNLNARLTDDRQGIEIRPQFSSAIPPVIILSSDPANLRDLHNNPGSGTTTTFRFMTSLLTDVSGPRILGISPESGTAGAPTNSAIQILFNRPVDPDSALNGGIVLEARGVAVPYQPEVSGALFRLNGVTLLPNTSYRVRVTTKLFDARGIAASQETSTDFTTSSSPHPEPSSSVILGPRDASVPRNARIVVRSARRIPAFAPLVLTSLSPCSGPSDSCQQWPGTASLQEDGRTLVFTPRDLLPAWARLNVILPRVLDITGAQVTGFLSFSTTDQIDLEPPALDASTPAEGDADVPVNSSFRFALNKPVGLMTPDTAIRLTRSGQAVAGKFQFSAYADPSELAARVFTFTPDARLDPGADYELELAGVADRAGNVMPSRKIHFRTASDSTVPSTQFQLVSATLDSGAVGPLDPLVFEFNLPVRAGSVTASVVGLARQGSSSLSFPHPVRTEVSGSTLRVIPLLAWPAKRELTITVTANDHWARSAYYYNSFVASSAGDSDRPEVVSISPPGGTPYTLGQAIRVTFSKPILNASQVNGGLTLTCLDCAWQPTILWSDDRTTATILPVSLFTGYQSNGQALSLAVTPALVDLSGNPAKAFTALFPFPPQLSSPELPSIVRSWPDRRADGVDVRTSLTLYLSGPVDVDQLNRAVWFLIPTARIPGVWRVSAGGRIAAFQPEQPWPAGSTVRLMQLEPVLKLDYGYEFTTPASPSGLSVVRTSLHDPHPANAVVDVEFSQDLPAGRSPLLLQLANPLYLDFPFDETRPRPNVVRLVPRSTPPVGGFLRVITRPESSLVWGSPGARVAPVLQAPEAQPLYRSPLPGSTGVPLNVRVSVVFSADLNEVSASEAGVTLTAHGVKLPAALLQPAPGARLTLVPLSMLPANSQIDVAITGLEDRLGRPLPELAWSFATGDSLDITPPVLLYSNTSMNMDPQANAVFTFDKPLDPAASDRFVPFRLAYSWSLSSDLRSLYLMPAAGWRRGESVSLNPGVSDWSGNLASTSVSLQVAFDSETTPPVLRAASLYDGQQGLPLSPVFTLLFNKPLGSEALRQVRLTAANGDVPLLLKSTAGNRMTLRPPYLLAPLTNYQLIVEGVQDAAGNIMSGRTVISFITGESLTEGTTNAVYRFTSLTAPITVLFSQPVDVTALVELPQRLTALDPQGGGGATIAIPSDTTWSDDRTRLTVTPRQPLVVATSYTLSLNGVTGSAGSALSQASFSFTPSESVDLTPARVMFQPADGASGVPLNVRMQVTFSRPPQATPAVRLYENGVLVPATLGSVYGGFSFTGLVTLSRQLRPNQGYRIEVDGFRDELNNEIAPSSASFTTGASGDSSVLRLVSSSPANNEVGVAPETPWGFTFNQALAPFVFLESPPQSSRTLPFTYTTRISGALFSITPAPAWPAASTISLVVYPSTHFGIPSLSSWTGAVLSQAVTLGFRTAAINDPTPPVLEAVEPPAGSTIPGRKATVTLRFSKPVSLSGAALQIFYGADKISATGTFSKDFRSVSYDLQPPANSRVTIVGTSGIRDNSDNPMEPFVLEFNTGENAIWGQPSVELTEPARTWSVPADTQITLTFDRPMDSASVLAALHVTENGQNTAGSVEVLREGRAYRFHPAAPFGPGSAVRVFLLPTAQDTNGQLCSPGSAWPVVLSVEGVAPLASPLELTRRGFPRTAPADSLLEFELNAELDPSSVDGESVWLRRGSSLVPGEVSLRGPGIVQFRPAQPLESGADYVLTAGSALRSLDGRPFAGQDLAFRAAPPLASPDLESVSEIEWHGRRAVRVRFTGPVSPLASHGLSLDLDGTPVPAETLSTTDDREFLLIPAAAAAQGTFHLTLDRVPEANGRLLPFRRMPAGHGAPIQ